MLALIYCRELFGRTACEREGTCGERLFERHGERASERARKRELETEKFGNTCKPCINNTHTPAHTGRSYIPKKLKLISCSCLFAFSHRSTPKLYAKFAVSRRWWRWWYLGHIRLLIRSVHSLVVCEAYLVLRKHRRLQ
jgi:hypothetical protein